MLSHDLFILSRGFFNRFFNAVNRRSTARDGLWWSFPRGDGCVCVCVCVAWRVWRGWGGAWCGDAVWRGVGWGGMMGTILDGWQCHE